MRFGNYDIFSWTNSLNNKKEIKGKIGYLGLTDWWLASFSKEERDHIIDTFKHLWGEGNNLIEGEYDSLSTTKTLLLKELAGWFKNETDRKIGYKMFEKAELHKNELNLLDLHFYYQSKMQFYYRFREIDDFALDIAVEAGLNQICLAAKAKDEFLTQYKKDTSLPSHAGYKQLCIIYEKQNEYKNVLALCEKAKSEGWKGERDKIINRINKKIEKK